MGEVVLGGEEREEREERGFECSGLGGVGVWKGVVFGGSEMFFHEYLNSNRRINGNGGEVMRPIVRRSVCTSSLIVICRLPFYHYVAHIHGVA